MSRQNDKTTEEKILEAAKEVFMKYGFYGARMQDIADTAGMNKALLHYYFRNKEKLFDKIFEGALSRYFEAMDVFSSEGNPVINKLIKYSENLIDFYSEFPHMTMFILKEIGNDPTVLKQKVQAAKKNKSLKMIEVMESAMKKGEIRKTDTALFLINIQSLCCYPFLASPMFRHSLKSHGKEWEKDFSNSKLKLSVRKFIESTLSL